jgi:hypothetical protein
MNSVAQNKVAEGASAILKPGFTALSNGLVDSGLLARLKPTELALFLVLGRFSTGFLRLHAIIGEQKLLELTGASPRTLYEAKKGLVEKGLVVISHTRTGRCCYQLAPWLQPMITAEGTSPCSPPQHNPCEQPQSYKEFKETKDHHLAPPPSDDDFLGSVSCKEGPVENGRIVDRLKSLGVHEFMAFRIAKTADPQVITRAIERLQKVTVANPAGYLISEILRGGYKDRLDSTAAQRDFHKEVQTKRQLERQVLEHQREDASEKAEKLWRTFWSLPEDHRDEIRQRAHKQALQEGFTRIPGWSEEHPVWRGLILELFSSSLSSADIDSASKLSITG